MKKASDLGRQGIGAPKEKANRRKENGKGEPSSFLRGNVSRLHLFSVAHNFCPENRLHQKVMRACMKTKWKYRKENLSRSCFVFGDGEEEKERLAPIFGPIRTSIPCQIFG